MPAPPKGLQGVGEIRRILFLKAARTPVDGVRAVNEIHQWLQAEFGPIRREDVAAYLMALEKFDVLRWAKRAADSLLFVQN